MKYCTDISAELKQVLYSKQVWSRYSQVKLPGTPTWLFDHRVFKDWENTTTIDTGYAPLLTLRGKPGTGKSVLIKEAFLRAKNQHKLVLYHHFDQTHNGKSGPQSDVLEELCTSLLYQLLRRFHSCPENPVEIWRELLRNDPANTPWSISELQAAILQAIAAFHSKSNEIFIFIDALEQSCIDESDERRSRPNDIQEYIKALLHNAASEGWNLRICCSRRHVPTFDILEAITKTIIVEEHNSTVLQAFTSNQLSCIEDIFLRRRLKHKIKERAANDFAWTTIVVRNILSMSSWATDAEILRVVDQMPQTHKEMFDKLLERDDSPNWNLIVKLLQMVSGAARPMTPDQFRHALAFDGGFPDSIIDTIVKWERSEIGIQRGERFAEYLCQKSRGLIEIHNASEDGEIVRFSHSSLDSFLREPNSILRKDLPHWDECCHLLLLKKSLDCLPCNSLRNENEIAFTQYAAENWSYHARRCGHLFSEVEDLEDYFFVGRCSKRKTRSVIERTIEGMKMTSSELSHLIEAGSPLLVLLALKGCTSLLERHLMHCSVCKQACTSPGPIFLQALRYALIARWTDTALWLLKTQSDSCTRFDIDALHDSRTLLYSACYFGKEEVVEFLLERHANPLKRSPAYKCIEYPLHVAIEKGLGSILKGLLKHGKVIEQFQLRREFRPFKGSRALHLALRSRQQPIVRLAISRILLRFAPKGCGILDEKDDAGLSVIDLAKGLRSHGDPTGKLQDMADEIQDFIDDEKDRNSVSCDKRD